MNTQLFHSQLSDVSSSAKDTLGSLRLVDGKWYKYVKVKNITADVVGAAGDAVAYDAEDGAENNTVVIDLNDADNPPICAGFLMGTYVGDNAAAEYGWIQLTGALTTNTALGGSAGDGHLLYLTTTDKTLSKALDSNTALLQACAIANDASAKKIIATCPF